MHLGVGLESDAKLDKIIIALSNGREGELPEVTSKQNETKMTTTNAHYNVFLSRFFFLSSPFCPKIATSITSAVYIFLKNRF